MREAYRCIATLGKVVAVLVSRLRCHVSRPQAAPEAFAVAVPLLPEGSKQTWATGICRRCAEKRDGALLQKLVQRMREHYPDLTLSSAATLCPRMLGAVDTR